MAFGMVCPDLEEQDKVVAQKKKDDAKLCVTQLAEKRWQETTIAKERAAREATQKAME